MDWIGKHVVSLDGKVSSGLIIMDMLDWAIDHFDMPTSYDKTGIWWYDITEWSFHFKNKEDKTLFIITWL